MDKDEKEKRIHAIAKKNRKSDTGTHIIWSAHAIRELIKEEFDRTRVENVLEDCTVIEDYPERKRELPDCLCLGTGKDDQPIHAVVAIDKKKDRLLIITVYRPSSTEWKDDWKTRKE